MINSRERVKLALSHREPDRVPFDLGSTVVTGIHVTAYRALRAYLGLPEAEPVIDNMTQQLARVDDDLVAQLRVDVRSVAAVSFGVFGIEVKDMGDSTYYYDEFGIGWRKPKDGGLYYDMFDHPLAGKKTVQDLDCFPWPDPINPQRFEGLAAAAHQVADIEGRAVVAGTLTPGICEMAGFLRGFEDYFADLASDERLLCRILDKVVELKIAYWSKALPLLGDRLDVAMENDDFAGQDRLLMSPSTYRRLVKPRHRKVNDYIHAHSSAKVFFHTCGAVRAVIPDLIEEGVDILNPVQVSARGMDSAALKRDYGRDLCFWGGGVDTQRVLAQGTPAEVRADTRRRLDDLMPGGGFVFNPVHNVQADVPPQNFMAMWETLQECGVY